MFPRDSDLLYKDMRKFIYLLIVVLSTAFFAGCNKLDSPERNGIFVNGVRKSALKSCFVGGGIADPSKGTSYRCHIYSEHLSEGPDWNEVQEKVFIGGFKYKRKEYGDTGDFIDHIFVRDVASIGDLVIPMNQGKYEGGNELVSSVSIIDYKRGVYDKLGNQTENARFQIRIVLKDKRKIEIRYVGNTPYDGYY